MMQIYCDGLCEPNPDGIATWGFCALDDAGQEVHAAYGCLGQGDGMTNNLAEYEAVLQALMWAYRGQVAIPTLYTDSKLVVEQVLGRWPIRADTLRPLAARVQNGMKACHASLLWISRDQNARADELSRIAYRQACGQTDAVQAHHTAPDAAIYITALRALDSMPQSVEDGFETDFLSSNMERLATYGNRLYLSDKQRGVIFRMADKYLPEHDVLDMFGQMRLTD